MLKKNLHINFFSIKNISTNFSFFFSKTLTLEKIPTLQRKPDNYLLNNIWSETRKKQKFF